MKDLKIIAAIVTACVLGLASPVFAKSPSIGGGGGHERAERNSKADRQARREQKKAERAAKRNERRQDRKGDSARHSRRDFAQDRRSERWDRRAERSDRKSDRRADRKAYARWDGERGKHRIGGRWSDHRADHSAHRKHRGFDNRIDRRQERQYDRIRKGWRSGEITHREMKHLRKDQRKIRRMERRFGSDGLYTKRERRKLNNAMDRASQRIYRSKHNYRTQDYWRPYKRRW